MQPNDRGLSSVGDSVCGDELSPAGPARLISPVRSRAVGGAISMINSSSAVTRILVSGDILYCKPSQAPRSGSHSEQDRTKKKKKKKKTERNGAEVEKISPLKVHFASPENESSKQSTPPISRIFCMGKWLEVGGVPDFQFHVCVFSLLMNTYDWSNIHISQYKSFYTYFILEVFSVSIGHKRVYRVHTFVTVPPILFFFFD